MRKGARGTTAYFFKRLEVRDANANDDDEDATKRIPLLRAFTLFHATQIAGMPEFVPPTVQEAPWRAPDAVETIIANSGAVVRIGGDRAFYSSATDHIQVPPPHASIRRPAAGAAYGPGRKVAGGHSVRTRTRMVEPPYDP